MENVLKQNEQHRKTAEAVSREERSLFIARVFLGCSLSVLIHVIISVATYEMGVYIEPRSRQRESALMEWIEPSDFEKALAEKNGQIVRQTVAPSEVLDLNPKAKRRFVSEEVQTVKEETQARNVGLTENRVQQAPASSERSTSVEKSGERAQKRQLTRGLNINREEIIPNSIFEEGLGDITAEIKKPQTGGGGTSRTLFLPSDPRVNPGTSTIGERVPEDIRIGDFTALNTDRFVFYTFYARIDEQIRNRWVRYMRAVNYGGGDIPPGTTPLTTNLEMVLNREGEFIRAIIHEGSGSRDVDNAPILAFREARIFPHPPREMVKDDGTIRLLYSFTVLRDSRPLARSQSTKADAP